MELYPLSNKSGGDLKPFSLILWIVLLSFCSEGSSPKTLREPWLLSPFSPLPLLKAGDDMKDQERESCASWLVSGSWTIYTLEISWSNIWPLGLLHLKKCGLFWPWKPWVLAGTCWDYTGTIQQLPASSKVCDSVCTWGADNFDGSWTKRN